MHPDNLGKQFQWFHGTSADLAEGDMLVPGEQLGKNNFPPAGDNSKVWLSPAAHYAFGWASRAVRRGTVHVYEVEPTEPPLDEKGKGFSTSGAKIVKKVYSGKAKV